VVGEEHARNLTRLDALCADLTALCLQADHPRDVAEPALLDMTNFERLPAVLELAAEIPMSGYELA